MTRSSLGKHGTIILLALAAIYYFFQTQNKDMPLRNFSTQTEKKIVAFGDSLTFGHGATSKDKTYPAKLQTLLGLPVANLGRNGDSTTTALNRLDAVLDEKPNYVLITLGGNDLRHQIDLKTTLDQLQEIFSRLQQQGAAVAYLAIDPPLVGDNWNMAIRDLVRVQGVLWIDDIMKNMWGDNTLMSDTIHPNDKGYELIASRVHAELSKYINAKP